MPIYEYRCAKCRRVSSFLVRSTASHEAPRCPRCGHAKMERAFSRFAAVGARKGGRARGADEADGGGGFDAGPPDDGFGGPEPDLGGMERLLEGVDENDPRSMGRVLRSLSQQTGEPMDAEMEEVVRRLEDGEDPEKIEEKMGDLPGSGAGGSDDSLYDG